MKYRFIDGFVFEAETPEAICTAIWKSMKFSFRANLQEWMDANSRIMSEGLKESLRTDSPKHHVEDMLRFGIIKRV